MAYSKKVLIFVFVILASCLSSFVAAWDVKLPSEESFNEASKKITKKAGTATKVVQKDVESAPDIMAPVAKTQNSVQASTKKVSTEIKRDAEGRDPWEAFTAKLNKEAAPVKVKATTMKEKAEELARAQLAKVEKKLDEKIQNMERAVNAKLEPVRKRLKELEKDIITKVNKMINEQLNKHIGEIRNLICSQIDGKIDEKVPSVASKVKGPAKDAAHWVVDTALPPFIKAVCTILDRHRDSSITAIASRIDERLCFKVRSLDDYVKIFKPILAQL